MSPITDTAMLQINENISDKFNVIVGISTNESCLQK